MASGWVERWEHRVPPQRTPKTEEAIGSSESRVSFDVVSSPPDMAKDNDAADVEQQCIRLAWSAAEKRCEAAFEEWDTHSHLSGWADSARRMLHAVQASQKRGSLSVAVKEADDIRRHIQQWPAKVDELAGHSALDTTSLNLIGLQAAAASSREARH